MNANERAGSGEPAITKRRDGKYEQRLGDRWSAEYYEERQTGLWRVDVYHHDVAEWVSSGHASLEEAARAAREYFDQV